MTNPRLKYFSVLFMVALLAVMPSGCTKHPTVRSVPGADEAGYTAPTQATELAQEEAAKDLPLDDPQDFRDAERGLIERDANARAVRTDGRVVWAAARQAFIAAPASVSPSLWRQAKLNNLHGLYKVTDGIYQVRGYDVSNLTLIRGKTGWIAVDPLTSEETAASAIALARKHLGEDPITAVIFTHSHLDHFAGVNAVLPESARTGVPIVAPKNFMEEATSENVIAGVVILPRSERGHVDTGLGQSPARGTIGIATPTELVDHTPQEMVLDGVKFVFQYTPESEAPAEMTFYLPEHKAFCGAEIVSRTMHNLYTLRGAKVRDALKWSGYIDQAIDMFGNADVVFASHGWPTWGRDQVIEYLKKQRDTYKYIHDQTLRLAGNGLTPKEIAEAIDLPKSLRSTFANRGYYGTVRHNAKAVYQWYFGWYDGNPANLDPLPPEQAAAKYIEAMGGVDVALTKAQAAFDQAEYRWAAMLLNDIVFAAPGNSKAEELLATTYDQLGYRAESGPWRDEYLTGAYELRHGATPTTVSIADSVSLLRRVPTDRFFDAMATRIDGNAADGKLLKLNIVFTDVGETHVLTVENAVLHHKKRNADPNADATVKLTRDLFLNIITRQAGLRETIFSKDLDVEGSRMALLSFFSLLTQPNENFPIVTP
jgi:alkyl sulfatase BDS1-like metallo-beta-lactamase superfamily hydrolase